MNNTTTHLIQNFPSAKRSMLTRVEDGMVIAARQDCGVAFGLDPRSRQQRVFVSEQKAMAFLRKLADTDEQERWPETRARIEEVDAEPRVVGPGIGNPSQRVQRG